MKDTVLSLGGLSFLETSGSRSLQVFSNTMIESLLFLLHFPFPLFILFSSRNFFFKTVNSLLPPTATPAAKPLSNVSLPSQRWWVCFNDFLIKGVEVIMTWYDEISDWELFFSEILWDSFEMLEWNFAVSITDWSQPLKWVFLQTVLGLLARAHGNGPPI